MTPGPIPKREAERSRRNKSENEGGIPLSKGVSRGGKPLAASSDWHPRARQWYRSLTRSGMADYYEQSDWATAAIIADGLTEYYKRPTAMMLATLIQAMTSLGTTEGERRRMRIELEPLKESETSASIVAIDTYRAQLGVQEA